MAAPNYLQQAGIVVSGGDTTTINAVNEYLNTLSSADRNAAIKTLQGGNPAGILGNMTLPWSQINPMPASTLQTLFTQVQSQYKPAAVAQTPAEQQRASANQAQSTADTAATTATAQLPEQTTLGGQGAEGIPVVGASGATIPGTTTPSDYNSLLNNYYATQFAAAGQDPTQLAQLAGMDPTNLQAQYQAYLAGIQKAMQGPNTLLAHQQGGGQGATLTLQQFAQQKAQNNIGPWAAVMQAINGIWQSQTGAQMPASVLMGIISRLNALPQAQQSNILYAASLYMTNAANAQANGQLFDQTGSYASGILSLMPSTILTYTAGSGTDTGSLGSDGYVGQEMQLFPGALQGEQVTTEIAQAFEKALNRAPTSADISALGTDPTPAAIQQYIDNQQMPGTHMTYGAYTAASSQLTPLWQQYFGKDPTNAELSWAVGKSPEDITDFIDNSPSAIPGVTIGVKNDYESFINSLDTADPQGNHAFSSQVDDSMISQLHQQVTAASTTKPSPGKM